MYKKIPFFDYPRLYIDDKKMLDQVFSEIGDRGAFIMQSDLAELEANIASLTGSKYAIGVANATDGLELSLMALGLHKGDEVICSTHTMLATASAIKTAGAEPVPVDIGSDNLIDPDSIEDAITSRTVGILPTQLNGRTCDMNRINEIAKKHGLFIIEDAAQALGSKYMGQSAGTFGVASAISFFPAKLLGCLGDGGIVLTSDASLEDKIYQLHDHGRDKNGVVKSWGRNSRLDNIQAAILNKKLPDYDKVIQRRREIASLYDGGLRNNSNLILPPCPSNGDHFDVFQNYELQAEKRDLLREFLAENGVGTLIQWGGKALHQWEGLGLSYSIPRAELFFKKCMMLPMNMFISNEDVGYIISKINEFYDE